MERLPCDGPAPLAGKVAVVTGGGAGIGRATARAFAAAGARVAVADIVEADAKRVALDVEESGGTAIGVGTDVSDETSVGHMVARVLAEFGPVDVLYANAGVSGTGTAHETSLRDWQRTLDVNLTGAWLSARAVLPGMLEQGSGVILLQASVSGLVGFGRTASYSASKGALIALARQMAVDYARQGIRVNALCPGFVPTQLSLGTDYDPDDPAAQSHEADPVAERFLRRVPMRRLGTPEDVARFAVFLASDAAAWVTGSVHPVDGGMSAW